MGVGSATVTVAPAAPVFSIIVPVYQAEEYLACCLDSILVQTFGDFEIICVNDGSTDTSREILAAYAERDGRIKIVDRENSGPSATRNAGMDLARGHYIMSVDADDFIESTTCAVVKNAFESSGAEIVTFGGIVYPDEEVNLWAAEQLSPRDTLYDGFESALLFEEKSQPYAWRAVFTREFIARTGLRYDEDLRLGEDAVLLFLAYPQSRKTLLLSDKLYYYRALRSGSLTAERHKQDLARIHDHFQVVDRILCGWKELGLLATTSYAAELFEWVVGFTARDIAYQTPEDQVVLLKELGGILAPYLGKRELRKLKLMRSTRWILRVILGAPGASAPRIRWSLWEYYRKSHLKKQ